MAIKVSSRHPSKLDEVAYKMTRAAKHLLELGLLVVHLLKLGRFDLLHR